MRSLWHSLKSQLSRSRGLRLPIEHHLRRVGSANGYGAKGATISHDFVHFIELFMGETTSQPTTDGFARGPVMTQQISPRVSALSVSHDSWHLPWVRRELFPFLRLFLFGRPRGRSDVRWDSRTHDGRSSAQTSVKTWPRFSPCVRMGRIFLADSCV